MSTNVVKSVGRVFGILELFCEEQAPMTATEMANKLGYPKSSADALLKSLVTLGYVTLDQQSMRYFPSLRVTKLGEWLPGMFFGQGDTLAMLTELHSLTGETITLSMANELNMQMVTVIPGTFPISLNVREGMALPILSTAIGIVQLSTRSDEDIENLVQRANRRAISSQKRIELPSLMAEIEKARAGGFAEAYDRVLTNTGAIAMALPVGLLEQAVVVAVGGLSERIKSSERDIIKKMRSVILKLGN